MAFLTTAQFARETGISVRYVRQQVLSGALPAFRLRDSGEFRINTDKLTAKLKRPGEYTKPIARSSTCIATICNGHQQAALHQYRNLPPELRARVDAWCARKGIDSPGLRLKQLQAPRPAVVLDMTCEGAD